MTVPNSMTMAEAVQLTGMKAREITRIEPVPGGVVIETCDGQRMLWDGSRVAPYVRPDLGDAAAAADVDAELVELRAEVERLQAENEALRADLAGHDPGDDGSADDPADPGAELERLRAEAEALGIKVDGRWGAERLRQAIAEAPTP